MNGITDHDFSPSNAWTPVMPWNVNSMRDLPGRFFSSVNGASTPGPTPTVPVMRVELSALIFSSPPMAW